MPPVAGASMGPEPKSRMQGALIGRTALDSEKHASMGPEPKSRMQGGANITVPAHTITSFNGA